MTTKNFEKWVWGARALRHVLDLGFSLSVIFLVETSATILTAIKFIVVDEKAIYFQGTGTAVFVWVTGMIFILMGGFTIFYVGRQLVFGARNLIFGQSRGRKLSDALGYANRVPSDSIKSGAVVDKLVLIVVVFCAAAFMIQSTVFDMKPDLIVPTISWLIRFTVWSIATAVALIVILAVYLRVCKIQLQLLLGQRRRKRPKSERRRCPRTLTKAQRTHSWSKLRPKRWLDSHRFGRQRRARL